MKEYYYIEVDSETKKGQLEFRYGSGPITESHPISDFKLMESREIVYHSTEGDTVHMEHGPKSISFTMMGVEE